METRLSLINHLKNSGVLKTLAITRAFEKIDRLDFVPKNLQDLAYEDEPLPISQEQTISQPYTVAFMLELLNPQKKDRVLDVGSGSGYTTALLAEVVGEEGQVIGVEIIPELVTFGKENLAKYNFDSAEIRQASDKLGLPDESPFDKILVSAAAREIPKVLVEQLKIGGIMVIPVVNDIYKIEKNKKDIKIEKYGGFSFVPLVE